MGKRFKLTEIEVEYGDLHKVIPELVNQGGQKFAAQQLGTSQATISSWLKKNGYEVQTVWALTTEARAAIAATKQNQPIKRERQAVRESEAVL